MKDQTIVSGYLGNQKNKIIECRPSKKDPYDTDPIPVSELYPQVCDFQKENLREDGETTKYSGYVAKEYASKGSYRPWFHTRFARTSVALPRHVCTADLKQIVSMVSGNAESPERKNNVAKPAEKWSERFNEKKACLRSHDRAHSTQSGDDSTGHEEESETWVECDDCGKWRRIPQDLIGHIDLEQNFFCTMIPGLDCKDKEEEWEDNGCASTRGDSARRSRSSKRRSPSKSSQAEKESLERPKKVQRKNAGGSKRVEVEDMEPLSPQDITAFCGAVPSGSCSPAGVSMSRLQAVIQVLRFNRKPMYYELITRQALRLGLIRFTGSQGTAGESMKAFLNKTIREHKCPLIVNFGKGVYGLREWLDNTNNTSATSPNGPAAPGTTSPRGAAGNENNSAAAAPPGPRRASEPPAGASDDAPSAAAAAAAGPQPAGTTDITGADGSGSTSPPPAAAPAARSRAETYETSLRKSLCSVEALLN